MLCNIPDKMRPCYDMVVKQLKVDQDMVHICVENNSYMPLTDRILTLYCVKKESFSDFSEWEMVPAQDQSFESDLDFVLPMQKVWAGTAFHLRLSEKKGCYMIVRLNDSTGNLSSLPDWKIKMSAEEFTNQEFWDVVDIDAVLTAESKDEYVRCPIWA